MCSSLTWRIPNESVPELLKTPLMVLSPPVLLPVSDKVRSWVKKFRAVPVASEASPLLMKNRVVEAVDSVERIPVKFGLNSRNHSAALNAGASDCHADS